MEHRVVAYSGCSYASEPREFFIGDDHHFIKHVRSTWVEQTEGLEGLTRQVWRVTDENGEPWRLTYYWTGDFWEVVSDRSGEPGSRAPRKFSR